MAHEWEDMPFKRSDFGKSNRRRCKKCQAEQELYVHYEWMRVASRRWLPLVGRCPKDKKVLK
jgi:hypothetical protein